MQRWTAWLGDPWSFHVKKINRVGFQEFWIRALLFYHHPDGLGRRLHLPGQDVPTIPRRPFQVSGPLYLLFIWPGQLLLTIQVSSQLSPPQRALLTCQAKENSSYAMFVSCITISVHYIHLYCFIYLFIHLLPVFTVRSMRVETWSVLFTAISPAPRTGYDLPNLFSKYLLT